MLVLTLRRTRGKGGGCHPRPAKAFLSFLLEDKTSAPDVFITVHSSLARILSQVQ